MQKVFDLTPEKKMWLTKQLEELNIPEDYIEYVMNTAWFEVCTDVDELETIIKTRWNLEFENLGELYDYLGSPDCKDITVLSDDDSYSGVFLVSVDTMDRGQ